MRDQDVDNIMVMDWWWNQSEYRIPSHERLERERQAYDEAEREDKE